MSTETRPYGEPAPQLLPGTSCATWNRRLGYLGIVTGVWFFTNVAIGFLSPRTAAHGHYFRVGIVVMLVWFVPLWLWMCIGNARAVHRERAAGYTTYSVSDRKRWVLDPKTGAVVRPPQA